MRVGTRISLRFFRAKHNLPQLAFPARLSFHRPNDGRSL